MAELKLHFEMRVRRARLARLAGTIVAMVLHPFVGGPRALRAGARTLLRLIVIEHDVIRGRWTRVRLSRAEIEEYVSS